MTVQHLVTYANVILSANFLLEKTHKTRHHGFGIIFILCFLLVNIRFKWWRHVLSISQEAAELKLKIRDIHVRSESFAPHLGHGAFTKCSELAIYRPLT